ncbi:hypothetical protein D0Y65_011994 [Glycine soja]|uniref:Uncharacterized protein n=1 Tax=Glycine soja TaxID=3848 RepID=A0A445KM75_GLYSO|nr:hypothetical protein D0Y65_011994 [Glycine soja]
MSSSNEAARGRVLRGHWGAIDFAVDIARSKGFVDLMAEFDSLVASNLILKWCVPTHERASIVKCILHKDGWIKGLPFAQKLIELFKDVVANGEFQWVLLFGILLAGVEVDLKMGIIQVLRVLD